MALRQLLRLGLSRTVPFVGGNRVEILVDGGPFFESYLKAIEAAEHYVLVESYIIAADRVGWRVAEALAERSKAGIEVAVCFDAYGSFTLDAGYVRFLADAGVKILPFRPVSIRRRIWPWSKRNHRKILVVDGRIGIVGGMNLAKEYADPNEGGAGWRDTAVRVEGPAIQELEQMFRILWHRYGGEPLRSNPIEPPAFPDGHQVRFIGNYARRERAFIRRAYLLAILNAQRTIRISNAYFVPDRVLRRALVRAARRGVVVEIIAAGTTDIRTALWATRSLYTAFLRAGIRIYEWEERVLHAKTAVIDGEWVTIGSSNLDHFSSFRNLEVNAGILGKRIGEAMDEQFVVDRARSRNIALALWKKRPISSRLLEWLFGFLRKAY